MNTPKMDPMPTRTRQILITLKRDAFFSVPFLFVSAAAFLPAGEALLLLLEVGAIVCSVLLVDDNVMKDASYPVRLGGDGGRGGGERKRETL